MDALLTEVIVRHEDVELARLALGPGEYVVGRSPDAEIYANTPLISRRHARIIVDGDQLLLEDLGSSNGTFVDEQPVTSSTRILPDQTVRLGPNVLLEVRRQSATGSTENEGGSLPRDGALPAELTSGPRYTIGSEVARGGMGAILKAQQEATHRTVAMKIMLGDAPGEDMLRFVEEAQVTAQLDHPNIVPIYELGVNDRRQPFYTMKLVRGITLKKVLQLLTEGVEATVKKYPLSALLTIFQKACDAVAFAHAKGVIHRDLKPENIMLGDFGSVLVMDWGLAKIVGESTLAAHEGIGRSFVASSRTGVGDTSRTLSGTIMGTPQYMSPEQARGEIDDLDARSDIFALGAILFHILHLRPIVTGKGAMEIVKKVARGELEWNPPRKTAPDSLIAVCRKALAQDRDQRYANVEQLQLDIAAYQAGFATSAEHAHWWKRAILAVKRNKVPSMAAALVLLASIGFGTNAMIAGRRAEREAARANHALADLRRTAPTFAAQARALVEQHRFEEALEALATAQTLAPAKADYRALQGNILQTLSRHEEAAAAYREALMRDPLHREAHFNFAFTEGLVREIASDPEHANRALARLQSELVRQGRSAEAVYLSKSLAGDGSRNFATWKPIVQKLGIRMDPFHYRAEPDGTLLVFADDPTFSDLRPLRGMPLGSLNINRTAVRDLSPLEGMPLSKLDIGSCPQFTDISALRGLPLRALNLGSTNVTDLTPLEGMKLEELQVTPMNTALRDVRALTGMALKKMTLRVGEGADFSIFSAMPLEEVTFYDAGLPDLSCLRQAPLRRLSVESRKVTDLRPLRGKALTHLTLTGTQVADLEPLRGMPLIELRMARTAVKDLSPLTGMKLKLIILDGCKQLRDLTPLTTMPTLEWAVLPEGECDPTPLRNLPNLKYLSYRYHAGFARAAQTVEEFWAEYDAQHKR